MITFLVLPEAITAAPSVVPEILASTKTPPVHFWIVVVAVIADQRPLE
jgi:hypothetical protein